VFAFLDDAQKSILQFVNNCLLVAGAFLVGYILGGVIGWALGKWAFKQKSPETLKQLGRPVGGIILAIIVALIVFTGMGKRFGPGGDGAGTPSDTGNKDARTDPSSPSDPRVTPPKVDPTPVEVTIRVTVLAGAAVRSEGKYYLIDDDSTARTLPELKETISARKAKSKGRTMLQVLFSSDPNLAPARNDPKVTDVTRWATEEAGLDVTFPASR
jgi:amino acid transporter